jgi:hypothetical protein
MYMYGAGELVFVRIWPLYPVKKEPDVRRTSVVGVMNNQQSLNPIIIKINMKQSTKTAHPFDFKFDGIE